MKINDDRDGGLHDASYKPAPMKSEMNDEEMPFTVIPVWAWVLIIGVVCAVAVFAARGATL
jgi:hypothetical protein